MKKILTAAAAAFVGAACLTVGPAGVASADPELDGTYTFTWDLSQARELQHPTVETSQWTIASCGSGCAHVDADAGSLGDMHLVNGRWEMTRDASLINCNPGSPDQTTVLSLDAATLQGRQDTTVHCAEMSYGGPASLTKT